MKNKLLLSLFTLFLLTSFSFTKPEGVKVVSFLGFHSPSIKISEFATPVSKRDPRMMVLKIENQDQNPKKEEIQGFIMTLSAAGQTPYTYSVTTNTFDDPIWNALKDANKKGTSIMFNNIVTKEGAQIPGFTITIVE